MPKYALLFFAPEELEAAVPADEQERVYRAAERWFARHRDVVRSSLHLHGSADARTVRREGYRADAPPVVTDGPYSETKEVVGGLAVVEVPDLDAAIELAKEWPTGGHVEVREAY